MKSIKEKRGITLIALAVTIVVILILAGVTIDAVFSENGIINKAKEAANSMNNAVANDQAELNDLLEELNEIMNSEWDNNIEIPEENTMPEPPEEEGTLIGDLIDEGTIKIGDHVAFIPTGDASYTVNGTYSGTGSNQIINKENLNWRVLDKTEDGKVRLISATPTKATVKLQGANGYNNVVYLLDELCNTLYKGENATAKSLKIEDIQNKMNLSVWDYSSYPNYGKTIYPNSKQYPLIVAQEKNQIINGQRGSLGISEQTSIVEGTSVANSWMLCQTFWYMNLTAQNYVNKIYYDLYNPMAVEQCWLSLRCIGGNSSNAYFYVQYISTSTVNHNILFYGSGLENSREYHICPIVTLESNVKIDIGVNGTDGSTPKKAWVIK